MAKTPSRGKAHDGMWVRPAKPAKAPTVKELWDKKAGEMIGEDRYLKLADIALKVFEISPAPSHDSKKELPKKRSA